MYTILSVTNRELVFPFCFACSRDAACCVFQIHKAESRDEGRFFFFFYAIFVWFRSQENSALIKLGGVSSFIPWRSAENWCEFFFKCLVAFSSENIKA